MFCQIKIWIAVIFYELIYPFYTLKVYIAKTAQIIKLNNLLEPGITSLSHCQHVCLVVQFRARITVQFIDPANAMLSECKLRWAFDLSGKTLSCFLMSQLQFPLNFYPRGGSTNFTRKRSPDITKLSKAVSMCHSRS